MTYYFTLIVSLLALYFSFVHKEGVYKCTGQFFISVVVVPQLKSERDILFPVTPPSSEAASSLPVRRAV